MSKNILVTGAAGFIGFHLCKRLLLNGLNVIGLDNMNNYYDINLKQKRLNIISEVIKGKNHFWEFIKADLINKEEVSQVFEKYKPEIVVNLAAQAGVRYSLENPSEYISSNIVGFANILECCRIYKIKNLLYASSSSVYGGNTKIPFSERDAVNHPVSLYAATKRSNELMAHSYSHLYGIASTGLRLFTVYGPWGRPDMAPMIFADAILNDKPIKIFNFGNMSRSFTYIDDAIDDIIKLIKKPALPDQLFDSNQPNASTSSCPYRILNIGNNESIKLIDFITCLEKEIKKEAIKEYFPIQQGDVINTLSDNEVINKLIDPSPKTSLRQGVHLFINWYKKYYK